MSKRMSTDPNITRDREMSEQGLAIAPDNRACVDWPGHLTGGRLLGSHPRSIPVGKLDRCCKSDSHQPSQMTWLVIIRRFQIKVSDDSFRSYLAAGS